MHLGHALVLQRCLAPAPCVHSSNIARHAPQASQSHRALPQRINRILTPQLGRGRIVGIVPSTPTHGPQPSNLSAGQLDQEDAPSQVTQNGVRREHSVRENAYFSRPVVRQGTVRPSPCPAS